MDVMGKTALGAAAAVAVLLLAGCGDDAGSPNDEPTPSSSMSSPTAIPPTEEVTTPGPTELVGIPEPGVEAGCWLLDGHLLLGGDEQLLSSGQRLRVTGRVERGVASFCQQGTPFRVDDIAPAQ